MFIKYAETHIVLFDGAMGTSIQKAELTEDIWQGKNGCNEFLNIASPETIQTIHENYFKAGANVAVTNTFGAISSVLSEYGIGNMTAEINKKGVEIARNASKGFENTFVGLSMGPGSKLPCLGHTTYNELYSQYFEQAESGIEADFFMIETAQDIIQVRAAVNASKDAALKHGKSMPIIVSFTVEKNNTLLTGSDISAIAAVMRGLPIYALGLNCALGPDMMYEPLAKLAESWGGKLYISPNAGIPETINGITAYQMDGESFANIMEKIITDFPINMAGGCCGTNETHIKALKAKIDLASERAISPYKYNGEASSLYNAVSLTQSPAPALIGERANATGSKAFRELLLSEDTAGITALCKMQEDEGAHFIDLSLAYAGRNEKEDYEKITPILNTALTAPMVIDSTDPETVRKAAERYSGKPIINSINLEDGGVKLRLMLDVIKCHPACSVALTIDEEGMATTCEKKFKIAERLYNIWTNEYGFRPEDLIIDPLTFSIGSGDETLKYAAAETIEAIKLIKSNLKGIKTVLGVSNVSFGLSPASRPILNSVFLREAVAAGLDTAIVHSSKLVPVSELSEEDLNLCLNLINGNDGALKAFIERFSNITVETHEETSHLPPEELLKTKIIKGDKSALAVTIDEALKTNQPEDIINNILFPAMQKVGELFGSGKMLLPFVLQSAETMKAAVNILEPKLKKGECGSKGNVILATVQGDVHDIGKNLADIIMANNGFKVYNLGIKVPVEKIIEKALEVNASAIGMSGLLVKSTQIMKENIEKISQTIPNIKVMLGGAALTSKFVNENCATIMPGKVFYCKDAFDNIAAMDGSGKPAGRAIIEFKDIPETKGNPQRATIEPADIPTPPFYGSKIIEDIDIKEVFEYLNKASLFSNSWGYKRKGSDDRDYDEMIKKIVMPEFINLKNRIINDGATELKAIYGYFKARREGTFVELFRENSDYPLFVFNFPVRKTSPFISIADYFAPEGGAVTDVFPMQIVTLGHKPEAYCKALFKEDNYKDYYMAHGLFTELTDALAEVVHRRIRKELNIDKEDSKSVDGILSCKYRGRRYSFGYPMAPNIENNAAVASLLSAERIGVEVNDTYQMVPEYTTSAFIIHHPKASY